MSLFWLSFADDDGFRGAILAEGSVSDIEAVIRETWKRGVNPGGEIKIAEVERKGPFELWNLYSREDIDRLDKATPWPAYLKANVCSICNEPDCDTHRG